jgi:hypothetical protein
MIIDIQDDKVIPSGRYVLWNEDKIQRAKASLPPNAGERAILIEYDKLGGRVTVDGLKSFSQSLWKLVLQYDAESVEHLTDDEIDEILRQAQNVNVPGSKYQKAKIESDIRHRKKIEHSLQQSENQKPNRWWEKTWIQLLFVLGAVAGIVGLYSVFK